MKKLLMLTLLFAFIVILGIMIVKVENKSVAKQSENQDSNNAVSNTTTTTVAKKGTVRKSSSKPKADLDNMVEITDNFFIESVNDVYLNLDDYVGKTIKMQGLVYSYEDYANGDTCYAVIRNTPGCCGADGLAGLDIRYDGEYPEENTWVEVIGVVGKDSVLGSNVPAILISSIEEKETGTTFVTN